MKKRYMVIIDTHSNLRGALPVIRRRVECESVGDALKAGMDYISDRRNKETEYARRILWDDVEVSKIYELVWEK